MTRQIPEASWATELHHFTNRNAGRATTIEVDSPHFGAQPQEHGYPLRGISYDARDQRILITLGQQASAERRLTHTIPRATAIYLLVNARGRDEALAITQDDSNTLLRFVEFG